MALIQQEHQIVIKKCSSNKYLVNCLCCGIPITIEKARFENSKSKRFFHSRQAYFKYMNENTKRVTVECSGCQIPFTIYKAEFDHNKTKHFYHNRACFVQYGNYRGHSRFTSKFHEYYRCGSCDSFVKQTDAIMYTTKNGKRTYPTCPNPQCGKFPIQLTPRSSKNNKIFRKEKDFKRI